MLYRSKTWRVFQPARFIITPSATQAFRLSRAPVRRRSWKSTPLRRAVAHVLDLEGRARWDPHPEAGVPWQPHRRPQEGQPLLHRGLRVGPLGLHLGSGPGLQARRGDVAGACRAEELLDPLEMRPEL